MNLRLESVQVGPWPMNCYFIRCPATRSLAIVDPGDQPDRILELVAGAPVCCILLTHGHPDHVGALEPVRRTLEVPVGVHPADGVAFQIEADFPLTDGMKVKIGRGQVGVVQVPGHTPGSVCLTLSGQVVVGDAIFPGGPGYTESPEALAESLASLARTVFTWPDDTKLHPGHGGATTVGAERSAFASFLRADHPADLHGDITWR